MLCPSSLHQDLRSRAGRSQCHHGLCKVLQQSRYLHRKSKHRQDRQDLQELLRTTIPHFLNPAHPSFRCGRLHTQKCRRYPNNYHHHPTNHRHPKSCSSMHQRVRNHGSLFRGHKDRLYECRHRTRRWTTDNCCRNLPFLQKFLGHHSPCSPFLRHIQEQEKHRRLRNSSHSHNNHRHNCKSLRSHHPTSSGPFQTHHRIPRRAPIHRNRHNCYRRHQIQSWLQLHLRLKESPHPHLCQFLLRTHAWIRPPYSRQPRNDLHSTGARFQSFPKIRFHMRLVLLA